MLSRVADNLYWMARYLERAEHGARLLGVKLEAMLEQSALEAADGWIRLQAAFNIAAIDSQPDGMALGHKLTFERTDPSSVLFCLRAGRDNARQVREEISTEMWFALNTTFLKMNAVSEPLWRAQPGALYRDLADDLHLFAGITDSTMRHGEGWHFIQLGRYIERAQLVARLLDLYFGGVPDGVPDVRPPRHFDWLNLLKSCTGFEAYCKVYTADIEPRRIADFLIFDSEFPHAVRFAVDRIQDELAYIGTAMPQSRRAACLRLAGRLKASLDYGQVDELLAGDVDGFLSGVEKQCAQIHDAVFSTFIAYGVDELLRA